MLLVVFCDVNLIIYRHALNYVSLRSYFILMYSVRARLEHLSAVFVTKILQS